MRNTTLIRGQKEEVPAWKQAAQQASQTTEDIEKSFFDLAYNALQQKGAPFMKAQYRVGFEIVQKSDGNDRICGIFIFRVGKDRYYAPVFFINGTIKGTDLLYRCGTKTFVPLTNDWCEYLISLGSSPEGSGIPISDRRMTRNQMNLRDIVEPPISRGQQERKFAKLKPRTKEASFGDVDDVVMDDTTPLAWWNSIKLRPEPAASALREFIEQDGGYSAIRKIANTAQEKENFPFVQMLFQLPVDHYAPVLEVSHKIASAQENLLVLHAGLIHNDKVASVTPADIAKGYLIEDHRKEAMVNDGVFSCCDKNFATVTDPGIYQVLMYDGTTQEMLVGYHQEPPCPTGYNMAYSSDDIPYPRSNSRRYVLINTADKHSNDINPKHHLIMGKYDRDLTPEIGTAKPETGKAYRIFNCKSKTFGYPLYVRKVETEGGLTQVYTGDYDNDSIGDRKCLTLNPDYDGCDEADKIYGKHCVFVEVASKKSDSGSGYVNYPSEIKVGEHPALNMMIFDNGFKKAIVKKANTNGYYLIHTNMEGRYSDELTPLAAKVFLMVKCATRESTADEILKTVDADRAFEFFYESTEDLAAKSATNIRMDHWPDFHNDINNDFNVEQQPQTQYLMQTQHDDQYVEPQRVGDRYSGGTGENTDNNDQIDTMTPMQLAELSQAKGNSALFEHGVIGALTNTYDSMSMIDKWLPDMEKALDSIGRTLFLFFWKPEDFAQAYGTDDQSQLENKLVSNFKSLGALVFEMLQKSKTNQEGSVSLH